MRTIPFHIEYGDRDPRRSVVATDTLSCYFWDEATNVVVLKQTIEQVDTFNGKRRKQEEERKLAREELPAHVKAKLDGLLSGAP